MMNKPENKKMNIMIQKVTIQFPEINLQTRDGHKLRGYFGNLFKEQSPLLHNHYETGELRYKYPLVQYKVLKGIPTLVALEEGAQLLTQLFLKIREIRINGETFPVLSKNIKSEQSHTGFSDELHEYHFQTLWMGLNQANHQKYMQADVSEQKKMLDRILVGNILSFLKGLDIRLEASQRLMVKADLQEKSTQFKEKDMLAFTGKFVSNALLPNDIGLGKGVSRGFGTVLITG